MQPLNEKQAQSVWSRVMQAGSHMEQPVSVSAPEATDRLPETLEGYILAEAQAAAVYESLSCKLGGDAGRLLRQLARQDLCHKSRWRALYFLHTGQQAAVKKACRPMLLPVCQQLRKSHGGAVAAQKEYEQAAKRWPEYAPAFLQAAGEEAAHAQCIFRILQAYLR